MHLSSAEVLHAGKKQLLLRTTANNLDEGSEHKISMFGHFSNSTTMFNILNFMHCMCLNIDVGLCKIWRVANEKAIYVCINLH